MLAFSGLYPSALFQSVAAELAWTGHRQREHFIREARAYDEKIGRKLADRSPGPWRNWFPGLESQKERPRDAFQIVRGIPTKGSMG
jgi:hypothetical protein